MKRKAIFGMAAGLLAATAVWAQADSKTGTGRASASVRVTVSIPGVVALEVPDEVTFDLAKYLKNGSRVSPGDPCPDNVFPPPPGCTGTARFDPTEIKTAALEARGLAVRPGESPLYVFSNGASGTLDLQASVEPAWSGPGDGPGFSTTALRLRPAPGAPEGPLASAGRHLAQSPETLLSLPARSGGWRKLPLALDLEIPGAGAVAFQEGTFTTVVTFTAARA
ncbi:MAG: hypothetical protein ACP5VN_02470 [Acidobacteriota bacterium]